jgi:hypothetical protein
MKLLIFFTAIAVPFFATAEITTASIKPFTSLCIADDSTGYNWRNGKWIQANFNTKRYLLQKLDYEKQINSENVIDRPLSCDKPTATIINASKNNVVVKACYSLRNFGSKLNVLAESQNCYESFKNGELELIQCPGLGNYKPDGLFVKLPSYISMDLSNNKDEKDSISLAIGKCSVL